jgi:hypothetical protein
LPILNCTKENSSEQAKRKYIARAELTNVRFLIVRSVRNALVALARYK